MKRVLTFQVLVANNSDVEIEGRNYGMFFVAFKMVSLLWLWWRDILWRANSVCFDGEHAGDCGDLKWIIWVALLTTRRMTVGAVQILK